MNTVVVSLPCEVVGASVGVDVASVIFTVGRGIVALALTRVGYSTSNGLGGPKHNSFLSGKFSHVSTSTCNWNLLSTEIHPL